VLTKGEYWEEPAACGAVLYQNQGNKKNSKKSETPLGKVHETPFDPKTPVGRNVTTTG